MPSDDTASPTREPEEPLSQARKMEILGRLTSAVVHSFNNRLTAVLGYSALLKAYLPPGSREFDAAVEVERAAKQAADLTSRLQMYCRQESAKMNPMDAEPIVRETAEKATGNGNGPIRVRLSADASSHRIVGDPDGIRLALAHLARNACEAMPAGGELAISTFDFASDGTRRVQGVPIPNGYYLGVRVTDEGPGIPAQLRSQVFQPFFTTKVPVEGAGLGLALVYNCVRAHGGFSFIEDREGGGASILVLLPLAQGA